MTTRRPRTVVAVSISIVAAVLALFVVALVRANHADRRDAEGRFSDRTQVTAALTESLFASTSGTQSMELAKDFGEPIVDREKLDQRAAESNLSFAVVADQNGNVLEATSEADSGSVAAALRDPSVARVVKGAPYSLSGYVKGTGGPDTLLYSLPFESAAGKRVYVAAFPVTVLATFLGGYLARVPGEHEAAAYILDSEGLVIGTPVKGQPSGAPVKEAGLIDALGAKRGQGTFDSGGEERAFAAAGVANSSWRVILTAPTSELYAGISSTVEWLILLALALAGMAIVWLLARVTRAATVAEAASARLEIANVELARSNLELSRSNSELEQFASVASHDLQEPLRKVQTFGDQLERRFGESIPDEGLDYLRRMRSAAGRMSVLIDDLLRFSRVTTRAMPPEPVDLTRIAREVTDDLEGALEETRGSVQIHNLPTVEADPLQMRQLLQNLIGNAIKFHRPGHPPEVVVESVAHPDRKSASFSVTDNGIGIEPEYRDRIFRVFERLHPRDVYAGTGIGLALCRKIVERHGGAITAESADGGGAQFVVVLPFIQPGRPRGASGLPGTPQERIPAHV
jgi:signal transduction histidine kinase